jgi:hypothetical protein
MAAGRGTRWQLVRIHSLELSAFPKAQKSQHSDKTQLFVSVTRVLREQYKNFYRFYTNHKKEAYLCQRQNNQR